MKRTIFCIIIMCVAAIVANAQTFEGRIIYKNTFKVPNGGDAAAAQMASMMGEKMEYFIKGGFYKSVLNGQMVQYQVFSKPEGKLYSKFTPYDTLYWMDVTVDIDPVTEVNVSKQQEEVLGLKCDVITIKTKNGYTYSFYFNTKYPIDWAAYKNHKVGAWAAFTEGAKSLPLKMVVDNPQFSMTSVAVEIKPEKLDNKVFEIPALPKKKAPF